MKKITLFSIFTVFLAVSFLWTSSAFAALGGDPVPDVSGLTVDEAHAKYGVGSGYKHPLVFEVNAKMGQQKCVSIGPDCSFACPTPKIYNQSSHHYLNRDGSWTIRVDVYYDINEPTTFRKPPC
ncbi:MAG: hypothetical protein D3904_09400 [Candidatus Electrothrix sp. EH2]|nr:hypothetical protein [Candidatus Electrothrix sp. EH2]